MRVPLQVGKTRIRPCNLHVFHRKRNGGFHEKSVLANIIPYTLLKGVCSDPQPHPPPQLFFKHMEILVPEIESYLLSLYM